METKVCGPSVVTLLDWTLDTYIEWYMVRFVIDNGHQKDVIQ
jgi:hypothetical protein